MQSRKDHVQAYQFSTARLSSALVTGDAFAGEAPLKRSGSGAVFGTVLAALVCAGAFVFGLISPGGATSWQQPRTIVVEKETGNRYVYLDSVLHPTLNTASAMLVLGADGGAPTFRQVSRNSLAGVPHGAAIGIPGAPDSVPQANGMLPPEWSLCSGPGGTGPRGTVVLGPAAGTALPADQRLVVAGADGGAHVVWRDTEYPVASAAVLAALGLGDVAPVVVPDAWLAALAHGPALAAPDVPGAGSPGPAVGGASSAVGQVFQVRSSQNASAQNYLLRSDGLAPLSPTAAALLAARAGAAPARESTPADVAGAPTSADDSGLRGLPDLAGAGTYRPATDSVCVHQVSRDGDLAPGTVGTEPVPVDPARDRALLAPGSGMLVAALPRPGPGTRPQQYLITDQGVRYAVSDEAARLLVPTATTAWLPPAVLGALPAGPALTTGAAARAGSAQGGP